MFFYTKMLRGFEFSNRGYYNLCLGFLHRTEYINWYTIDKFDFASNLEQDFWNREHVWQKSHGDFDSGDPFEVPTYTDAHNLKPVDTSMNVFRGEKDFDNGGDVVFNGDIETSCYSTTSTFEPRD